MSDRGPCNCDQALELLEAIAQIREACNADAQDLGDCFDRLCEIRDLCEEVWEDGKAT
jgi:hypothetical protein